MENTMFKTELNVLEILWRDGTKTAKEISVELAETINWNKATTYTIIKRCVEKGLIYRLGFDFTCAPALTKEDAQRQEFLALAEKMFDGSTTALLESLVSTLGLEAVASQNHPSTQLTA